MKWITIESQSMLNIIWLVLLAGGIVVSIFTGRIAETGNSIIEFAGKGVEVTIGMTGILCFWSGIIKIAQKSGAMKLIIKLLSPLVKFLIPGIPDDSPARDAVVMNLAANMLGMGNAATPLGIKAMQELKDMEQSGDTATDNMIMFIILNIASFQLVPTMVLSIRASTGSVNPGAIVPSVWYAGICALFAGVVSNVILSKVYGWFHAPVKIREKSKKKAA